MIALEFWGGARYSQSEVMLSDVGDPGNRNETGAANLVSLCMVLLPHQGS